MNFMIVVHDNDGTLRSVPAANLPANLVRHLDLAIDMALNIDAESEALTPKVVIGGISEADSQRLRFLDALEAYGVDSWDGYTSAREEAYPDEVETDESEPEAA